MERCIEDILLQINAEMEMIELDAEIELDDAFVSSSSFNQCSINLETV